MIEGTTILNLVIVLSCTVLLSWRIVGDHEENLKVITYVIPTLSDKSLTSSPCDYYITAHNYNCSKVSLNELINHGYEHFAISDAASHDIVFLSGTHIVNNTQSQNLPFFGKYVRHLHLIGDSNAHIVCERGISFGFFDVEEVTVSNIHFINCTAPLNFTTCNGLLHGKDHHCTTLKFACTACHMCVITVTNVTVIVANANCNGITVIFCYNWKTSFTLANSSMFTRGVGIYISTTEQNNLKLAEITVSSVSFHHSCFIISGQGLRLDILNVNFTGCSCISVISIKAASLSTLIMNSVTINDTKSQYLVNTDSGNVTFKGHCQFSNNRGAIMATNPLPIHKYIIILFSEANIKFIGNSIGKTSEALSAMIVADNATVTVNNSHIMFKNNYGSDCGGIATTNRAEVSLQNSKVTFFGNYGEQGGAMSFYSMSVLSINDSAELSTSVSSIYFSNNRAIKGGAIFVDDNSYAQNKKLQRSMFEFCGIKM